MKQDLGELEGMQQVRYWTDDADTGGVTGAVEASQMAYL
jgi:hypothetical protein